MSSFYTLPKSQFLSFIQALLNKKNKITAPVKTNIIRFQGIFDPNEIYLKSQSHIPVKGYFFQQKEVLFEYQKSKILPQKYKPQKRVFFGLRRCDLNAIYHQDLVFMKGEYKDPYYTAQREKSILIGYHCNIKSGKYCFCGSFDLKDFYDVMFFDKKDHYLIHLQTKEGVSFMKPFLSFLTKTSYVLTDQEKKTPGTDLLKKKDIRSYFEHPDWQKGADECLSCSACTILCPNCYCHEIDDCPSLLQQGCGKRERDWSSCQLKSFSRVAGNHIFREKRLERFKHRIYHQLQYFKEKEGIPLCVGCGRCIAECPKRIDFVNIINNME